MRKLILTILAAAGLASAAFAQALPDLYQSTWPYREYSTAGGPLYSYQGPTGYAISTNQNGGIFHLAFPSTNNAAFAYDILTLTVATNGSGNYTEVLSSDPYWGTLQIGGGSGVSQPTNTATASVITNEFVTGQYVLLRNQRSIVSVTLANATASTGGIRYSNAVTGIIRTQLVGAGDTQTNLATIFCEPNSMVAVTNATVIVNTSEINYQ